MPRLVSCALTALLLVPLTACSSEGGAASRGKAGDQSARNGQASGDRPAQAPVVFMLGDSYTVGIKSVPPEQTYAGETARRLGWQVVIAGQSGTGFVVRGKARRDFAMMYDAELAWRPTPDMVVISGGHNDKSAPPSAVAGAASQLLTRIRARWPQTHVVLVGPLWGGDPPPEALRTRDALRSVAGVLGLPFVDPLQERWITGHIARPKSGNAPIFILKDGTHPNPAGNRHIAERLMATLRVLGLDRPVLGRPPVPVPGQPAQLGAPSAGP